jgi:putative protein kinase ArgK-like GTPase of G3E family
LVRILEAYGFDVILIETAGAGQGDTAVRELVDCTVLLLQPETGDDLQWQKAGLLEVADVIVIHKADLPQAEQVEAQVRSMLSIPGGQPVPVVRVSAKTGEGVEALWTAIAGQPLRRATPVTAGHELLRLAQDILTRWFSAAQADRHSALQQLLDKWEHGVMEDAGAAESLLNLLQKEYGSRRE